jgi:hypothetical protein
MRNVNIGKKLIYIYLLSKFIFLRSCLDNFNNLTPQQFLYYQLNSNSNVLKDLFDKMYIFFFLIKVIQILCWLIQLIIF